MIEIADLRFSYPDSQFRLAVPSLEIETGSTAALIGPSGIGKTTLLNMISGVSVPRTGFVKVGHQTVNTMSDEDRRAFRIRQLGMVFQEFELLDYLSVLDNILLPFRISSALRLEPRTKRRARELADAVGLGDKLPRNVRRLSQGERQRTAVCRALIAEPSVLLCDEPTGNLDPANKGQVLDILFGYVRQTKTTLIAVTHDHELLPRFERIIDFSEFTGTGNAIGDAALPGP